MFISNGRPTALVVFTIILLLLHIGAKETAAQQQTGTLTGTITSPEKKPVNAISPLIATGVFVNLQEYAKAAFYDPGDYHSRGVFGDVENGRSRVSSNRNMGGLYTFKNLRPGVYNLVVEAGVLPDNVRGGYTYYRPQRIVGVVVKAGQETVLDITVHPGDKLQQSGDPKNNTLEYVGEPKGNAGDKGTNGWLEGTITNPDGQPVWSSRGLLVSGVVLTLKKSTGEQGSLQTDHFAGGFYSAAPTPGMWTVTVESGRRYDNTYRPMIISNVVIKPGVRTILNIIMKPGDALERVSAPQMVTEPVRVVAAR
jgi:hypothetical protein